MTTPDIKPVTFRIPTDLWKRVKVKCVNEEKTVTEVMITLLVKWLQGK